jgi:hypothetical protein
MNIPNGVKTETLQNLEFEAGLILKEKFDASTDTDSAKIKAKVLCATTGGIKVNVAQVNRIIKFDGVLDNTAGVKILDGWTGSVQFSTKEVDKEKVLLALGYASESNGKITLSQGVIPVSMYKDLYVLGRMSDGAWRQIEISKAMNTTGLQETRNDKGETEIAFDLQANYGIDTQDTAPIHIEYITVSSQQV